MAKRRATTELNRDNWDQEEESEDPGVFQKLNDDQMKDRVIIKARRSLAKKDAIGSSPFAAFSGFSKNAAGNPFNFLKNNAPAGEHSLANVSNTDKKENGNKQDKMENGDEVKIEDKKGSGDKRENEDYVTMESVTKRPRETMSSEKKPLPSSSKKVKPNRPLEYYRQLESLNTSVLKWMQLHLSKNGCCDFTPVFHDYKRHLDTLSILYPIIGEKSESGGELDKEVLSEKPHKSVNHHFVVDSDSSNDKKKNYGASFKSNTTNTSTFSFGLKTSTATSSNTLRPTTSSQEEKESEPDKKSFPFSFGFKALKDEQKTENQQFKPGFFATEALKKNTGSDAATGEDEYVPPKNDFVTVKEEEAFYSKRCKLFYKKGDTYVERGLGVLHLKPLDGKTQLLIRADTSLGNILLNIILSESLPMSKTGKNNVLLVCVPNPPVDTKDPDSKEAIPMLIRVKTSEDADELLETLNKHKS